MEVAAAVDEDEEGAAGRLGRRRGGDAEHGEEICAVVVRSPEGAELDAATLIAWSQQRLGRHKYPRRVEFFESLPLGPSGKILKRELAKDL